MQKSKEPLSTPACRTPAWALHSRRISEREFQDLIDALNRGPSMTMSAANFIVHQHNCVMSDRRDGLTAECVGTAQYQDTDYDFTAFLWFAKDNSMIAALFLTKGEFIAFKDEIDSIIQSIDTQ